MKLFIDIYCPNNYKLYLDIIQFIIKSIDIIRIKICQKFPFRTSGSLMRQNLFSLFISYRCNQSSTCPTDTLRPTTFRDFGDFFPEKRIRGAHVPSSSCQVPLIHNLMKSLFILEFLFTQIPVLKVPWRSIHPAEFSFAKRWKRSFRKNLQ